MTGTEDFYGDLGIGAATEAPDHHEPKKSDDDESNFDVWESEGGLYS